MHSSIHYPIARFNIKHLLNIIIYKIKIQSIMREIIKSWINGIVFLWFSGNWE
jgi:hypothetical protein